MNELSLPKNASLSDCEHYSIILCGVMEGANHLDSEGHCNARVAVAEVAEAMMNELSMALQTLSSQSKPKIQGVKGAGN
ncbi:hypothetical protein PVV74_13835 [Roseovarius sp. SK2]|uniref:hypothetical protein n=1 Tax=Roseovarius TaxID=74030 RepID=UPI00237ACEC4|nr:MULTISPECIES: hypothetical protein [unclassified Roseovarius]MDD9726546.1 hypothetical protein [Roseovarius sp. SK2]